MLFLQHVCYKLAEGVDHIPSVLLGWQSVLVSTNKTEFTDKLRENKVDPEMQPHRHSCSPWCSGDSHLLRVPLTDGTGNVSLGQTETAVATLVPLSRL